MNSKFKIVIRGFCVNFDLIMGSEKGLREAMASVSGSRNDNAAEEASSPDMLKNTPSNIRRLAHEIEQFEGRHKYLAQTTSPSDGGDVRWYFCKTHLAENGQFSGQEK